MPFHSYADLQKCLYIMKQNFFKTYAAIFFMLLFWGSAYVGIRAGLKSYSPGCLALLRYLVASLCIAFIYLHARNFRRLSLFEISLAAISGIFSFTIYSIALNYGELTVTAGIAGFIISQIPVILTLLAAIFFREKIAWFGWLGTSISFLGIVLIAIGESEGAHFDIGVIWILIATFSGSFYALLQKKLLKTMHPIELTALSIWTGTAAMLFYLPNLLQEIPKASLTATLWVVYIGIFPAAIAYLLWTYILAQMPTTKAASYLYLVPLFATALGWLILNEIPHPLAIIGGFIALGGAILVNRGVKHSAEKT